MKRSFKLFSVVVVSILAALVLTVRGRGQSLAGSQSPIIIKRLVLKNQTAGFGPITLFTPTSETLYRVSAYADVTPSSNGGDVCPSLVWTDEAGTQNEPMTLNGGGNTCAYSSSSVGGSLMVHPVTNQPVNITVGLGNTFDGQYNLLVTVEQL